MYVFNLREHICSDHRRVQHPKDCGDIRLVSVRSRTWAWTVILESSVRGTVHFRKFPVRLTLRFPKLARCCGFMACLLLMWWCSCHKAWMLVQHWKAKVDFLSLQFYGRRPIYLYSYAAFFAWMIPCAVATNIETILISRFFSGLSGSAFLSVAGGTIRDMFLGEKLSLPMSLYTGSTFLG